MSRFFDSLSSSDAPEYLQALSKLYERRPVTDLWNDLTAYAEKQWLWKATKERQKAEGRLRKKRLKIVYGPPGSGKSSASFEWVFRTCSSAQVTASWIDCDQGRNSFWFVEPNRQVRGGVEVTLNRGVLAPEDIDSKIVILDGLRQVHVHDWKFFFQPLCRRGVAVILVSSESVRVSAQNDIEVLKRRVPAWTKEEYESALADDTFWTLIAREFGLSESAGVEERKRFLEEKFETAGHSARLFFQKSVAGVKSHIDEAVTALSNIAALESALESQGNVGGVNSLISWLCDNGPTPSYHARFLSGDDTPPVNLEALRVRDDEFQLINNKNCFVSAYAARKILSTVRTDVETLKSVALKTENGAMLGYALEIRFRGGLDNALSTSTDINLRNNGTVESWRVTSINPPEVDILPALIGKSGEVGFWVFLGGYHKGFDAVQIYAANRIRFVQTTVGASHNFFLDSVHSLLSKLAANGVYFTHVDFVVVRPFGHGGSFSLNPARGALCQGHRDFYDETWSTPDPRDHVRTLYLAWN